MSALSRFLFRSSCPHCGTRSIPALRKAFHKQKPQTCTQCGKYWIASPLVVFTLLPFIWIYQFDLVLDREDLVLPGLLIALALQWLSLLFLIPLSPLTAEQAESIEKAAREREERLRRKRWFAFQFSLLPFLLFCATVGAGVGLLIRPNPMAPVSRFRVHQSQTEMIAPSRDGKRLFVKCQGGKASVWDVQSRALVSEIPLIAAKRLGDAAFSPDGRLLVTCGQAAQLPKASPVLLWDVETGRLVWKARPGSNYAPHCVWFSNDGQTLRALSFDGTLLALNAADGTVVARKTIGSFSSSPVAISPDGRCFAIVKGEWKFERCQVEVWCAETGKCLRRYGPHARVGSLCFSSDGRHLAYATKGEVHVRNIEGEDPTGDPRLAAPSFFGAAGSIAFGPDDETMAVHLWPDIHFFQVSTGALLGKISKGTNFVRVSPDGHDIFAEEEDGLIAVHRWPDARSRFGVLLYPEFWLFNALAFCWVFVMYLSHRRRMFGGLQSR